jgi:glyoxylase I family protein
MQEAGPTVIAPFPEKNDYFGNIGQKWMVNFRVRDFNVMAAQLQAAG